jgi:hypothetical protein
MHGVVLADDTTPTPPAAPAVDATPEAPAASAPRWPRGVIDRPLTLPGQLVLAGGDVIGLNTVVMTPTGSTTSMGFLADVALGYGVNDDLEVNAITPNYTFTLKDFEIKGPLDIGIGYKLLRGAAGGKLEMIARAIGGYDLNAEAVRPVRLGLHVQYNLTPTLAVFTHDIGLGNAGISIAVDGDPKPISLTLPVGVGMQVAPALWIEADTAAATSIQIANSANKLITDTTPLLATAIYNLMAGHLDAIAYFGFGDVQAAGDTFTFGVGMRYYAGKVD